MHLDLLRPGAIYTIGLNYRVPGEPDGAGPDRPLIYGKAASSFTTDGATLSWDRTLTANVDANIGVDEARVAAFVDDQERLIDVEALPDSDRGVGLYNLACAHAVAGRLGRAVPLLRGAFRLRPDLAAFAQEDADLVALRDELASLAEGVEPTR